jgi:glycosyltransferase involved in cell wall biosynthesis
MLKRLVESHVGSLRFRHVVVSLTDKGELGDSLRAHGVEVVTLGARSPLDTPRVLLRLRSFIRRQQPCIVQTWMYHADLLGGLAARLAGERRVMWGIRCTDVIEGTSRMTGAVRRLCAWLSHSVPRVIVCNAEAARQAHVAIGYDRQRMLVINNGFDLELLHAGASQRGQLRDKHGWADSEVVIGCVGRFNPYKDYENFVRAAGMVADQSGNVRFVMVGKGLEASNRGLMRLVDATGHSAQFLLLGERSDVPACLAAMDIFCLSSRSEGFPNVVGEAMAAGLPCAVTDVGDAAVMVGDTGIVVPKEDAPALAGALRRLIAMAPEERRSLGKRAQARANAEFSMRRARERFEALYLELGKDDASGQALENYPVVRP